MNMVQLFCSSDRTSDRLVGNKNKKKVARLSRNNTAVEEQEDT